MFTGAADELFASWDSGVPWGLNFSIPLAIDDDAHSEAPHSETWQPKS